jgi:hypothetical protein
MTDLHACHLSAPHLAASQPAAPRPSFMTGKVAEWVGFAMLCEVFGLIVLLSLG